MEIKGKTIGTGKPLLCVPVMESNKEEIIDELRTLAKSEADVVEWRIDVFADYKNYNAVREVFAAAAESECVDLIDLEFFEEEHPARKIRKLHKQGLKVIASHHDFYETPDREVMKMLLEQMCAGGADIVKLAVMPQNMEDVLKLLSVTYEFKEENPDTPVITMSMGKMGMISRLCGESFGSAITFAAHKKASTPGQMEMHEVADILERIHKIM